MLRASVQETIKENNCNFCIHMQASVGDYLNIGYVRKSPTDGSAEARTRLLNMMRMRLRNRCIVSHVFLSPSCTSSSPLLQRDSQERHELGDGNATDMSKFISAATKHVRLYVIDYASLTNDPKDLRTTLGIYKQIKEVAIDHGHEIEVLDRHALLHQNKVNKFKCRTKCIPRCSIREYDVTYKCRAGLTYYMGSLLAISVLVRNKERTRERTRQD
ncbi:hypothetical protein BCR43DRAFT_112067 [Syncephalastrum racemosum]|uniref:Uncharacterized protein n=1 Tax=Syncephalastrum racemosum TaxID=13706 RepID=A0A1X2H033_SYNRA|nr:hypothetical protein BCR43DRAFT_112067 [Syncephalastrum racemosum]